MNLLEKEQLLENPFNVENERMEVLVQMLDTLQLPHAKFLTKEDLQLIVYDIWAMLELGPQYKNVVTTKEVKQKYFRLFLLDFFAGNGVLNNIAPQIFCSEKRFFVALLFGKKLERDYVKRLEILWNIDESLTCAEQKQRMLSDVQSKWFQHLYKYEKEYHKILNYVVKQIETVEQIFGVDIWTTLEADHFDLLLQSIETNHFDEIVFWKKKFQTHSAFRQLASPDCSYVFCVQQDASMNHALNLKAAIVSTIQETMERSSANFIFVPFSETIEKEIVVLNSTLHVEQYFQVNHSTAKEEAVNYKNALNYALLMSKLELSKHENRRIYFICNEQVYAQMPTDIKWQKAVQHYKEANHVSISVIYLGDLTKYEAIWFADQVFLPELALANAKG